MVESFEVTGRGRVVVPDCKTDLPVGRGLRAVRRDLSGRVHVFSARKEWLLRRADGPEVAAFVVHGAGVSDLPQGCEIKLTVAGD